MKHYPHITKPFLRILVILLLVFMPMVAVSGLLPGDKEYAVEIHGKDASEALQTLLKQWSETLENREGGDAEDAGYMRYRFEQDRIFVQKSLEAEGYYQAEVKAELDEASQTATFTINPGVQFRFGEVKLELDAAKGAEIEMPALDTLAVKKGEAARVELVLEDEQTINSWLEEHHCLFSYATQHQAVLHPKARTVDVTYTVTTGGNATFGAIDFTGQETIEVEHLQHYITIKPGECFRASKLNAVKLTLLRSGLLTSADAPLPEKLPADGVVPITFAVKEKAHRSIKAGANFSTDIGPGITGGWEHRNFFSQGEKFTTSLSLAAQDSRANVELEKPFFQRKDQNLKLGAVAKQEDSDAFRTTGLTFSAGVERKLRSKWIGSTGVKYGFEQIKDQNNTENVALFSVPVGLSKDKRNDPLNPTRGWTVQMSTAPAMDTLDATTTFLKNRVGGSYYQALTKSKETVLALRTGLGSIAGVPTDTVPATERFYAGGGGSVRGYGYQLVGPLDAQNDPLGGRSFVELSTELRLRISEDYGAALFVDGGNVFDSAMPDFENGMRWGAGIGIRYYTSFGPIRADVAVPMSKRSGVDDPFQLYFSIGQAF